MIREEGDLERIADLTGSDNPTWESFSFLMAKHVDLENEDVVAFFPVVCHACGASEGNVAVQAERVEIHGDAARLVVGWREVDTGGDLVAFRWIFVSVPKSEIPEGVSWEVRDDRTGALLAEEDR